MYELKTNTAVRIAVGPLVDPGDYKTAETSLTVTGMSVEIFQIKGDGNAVVRTAFSPTASGGNNDMVHVTDDTTGMYDLELTAAQLNWLGNGRIAFYDVDGFIVHWIDIHVVSANYWDWKYGTGNVNSNVIAISGDTTAADNCELMFDGTGYAGGTTKLGVDMVAISGDATAADNLEAACDGNTYNVGGGAVVAASVTGAVGSVTGAVGSVTGAVGSVTAGVTLADDAITSAKFDESTAFPLKSADTGATAVARTGADSDTLETLSDQLDGVSTFDASSDGVNVTKWTGVKLKTPADAGWNT